MVIVHKQTDEEKVSVEQPWSLQREQIWSDGDLTF